jgi:hypothetical protein
MTSGVIDIDSLNPVDVIDGTRSPPLRVGITPPTDVDGAAVPPLAAVTRRYVRECPYGYLSLWVCAVCMKLGRDFRREFCSIPSEEDIRTGDAI